MAWRLTDRPTLSTESIEGGRSPATVTAPRYSRPCERCGGTPHSPATPDARRAAPVGRCARVRPRPRRRHPHRDARRARQFAERLEPSQDIFVTKHRIGSALDCEEHHLAPDEFEWKPATAKGQVAHRAIQLMLSWRGEPSPTELVDEAMARLVDEDRGIGIWMAALGPADEADLRGDVGRAGHEVRRRASRRSIAARTRSPRPPRSGRSTVRSSCGRGST